MIRVFSKQQSSIDLHTIARNSGKLKLMQALNFVYFIIEHTSYYLRVLLFRNSILCGMTFYQHGHIYSSSQ